MSLENNQRRTSRTNLGDSIRSLFGRGERGLNTPVSAGGDSDIEAMDQIRVIPDQLLQSAIDGTVAEAREVVGIEKIRSEVGYTPQEAVKSLGSALDRVNRQVVGREELLTQTLYALLTREHQLIFSRTGVAKSLYAKAIFGQFEGSNTFEILMTKGTPEEALVGSVRIDELKEGNIVHNTEGSIVDADFAFLDEIFDGNDVALRALLGILNEREFRKGKQRQGVKLHTAIATTNFLRASDLTEAVIDRFAFKANLLPDFDSYQLLRVDEAYSKNLGRVAPFQEGQRVPLAYLQFLSQIVEGKVPGQERRIAPHILFIKNAVIAEYVRVINQARQADSKPDLYLSPRTIAKSREVLNASALLRNSSEVGGDDLDSLKYTVCSIGDSESEDAFKKAIRTVTSALRRRDLEIVDIIMEAHILLEGILEQVTSGAYISPSFAERAAEFFGIGLGELTFGSLKIPINKLHPNHPLAQQLKDSFIQRVNTEQRKAANRGKQSPTIF